MRTHRVSTRIFSSPFVLVLALAVAIGAGDVMAQEKAQSNVKTEAAAATPEVQAVQNVSLARDLAAYGQRVKSPEALAVAAQILLDNPTRDVEAEKKEETGQGEPGEGAAKSGVSQPDLDAVKLLAEAEGMASGNQTALALVRELKGRATVKTRGRVGGAAQRRDRVSARSIDTYDVSFYGGRPSIVRVSGDGDTDLDLYVYDQNGNLIASDTDSSDECLVMWTPRWTGRFRIKISNLGRMYNNYMLLTN